VFYSTKNIDVLNKELIKLVPEGYNLDNIVENVDDFMILAWDLNNRNPRFFNKWALSTIKD